VSHFTKIKLSIQIYKDVNSFQFGNKLAHPLLVRCISAMLSQRVVLESRTLALKIASCLDMFVRECGYGFTRESRAKVV
jgi:hypothetical protein